MQILYGIIPNIYGKGKCAKVSSLILTFNSLIRKEIVLIKFFYPKLKLLLSFKSSCHYKFLGNLILKKNKKDSSRTIASHET